MPSLPNSTNLPPPSDSVIPQTPITSASIDNTSAFSSSNGWRDSIHDFQRDKPESARDHGIDLPPFRAGGGPGWGPGQKKWRLAAGVAGSDSADRVSRVVPKHLVLHGSPSRLSTYHYQPSNSPLSPTLLLHLQHRCPNGTPLWILPLLYHSSPRRLRSARHR